MPATFPWVCLTAAFLVALPVSRADDSETGGDLGRMQGRWTTDSFAGNPTSVVVKGNRLEVDNNEIRHVITITLDEKAKPEKTVDLKFEESTMPSLEGVTSLGIYRFESPDRLLIGFRSQGDRPTGYETDGKGQWRVELRRETGAVAAASKAGRSGKQVEPAAADSDAPLPEGWPRATAPGTIEVKVYPAYRSAIVREKEARMREPGRMFFPLFNHISRKQIAMTAPVVMTYAPQVIERAGERGEVSMEFLYARPDQGETGPGVGKVRVEDRPGGTFVCLGVQGRMDEERLRDGVARLRAWLRDSAGKWTEDGPPRELGYHGPMTREERRLWEVQLPIKPAGAAPDARPGDKKPS